MLKKRIKKRIIAVVLATLAAIIYISAGTYLYLKQDAILFPASKTPAGEVFHFEVPFEEVWIEAEDAKLHGLYLKADEDPLKTRGIIIFFHGNSERVQQFGATADEFTKQGFDYFIPDYRGYGKSTGKITSEKQFLADIDRIYDWAKQKYPENKIIVAGRSLGAAPAAYLGSKNNPKLVLMIASFFNIAAMKDIRYPYLPDFILKYKLPNNRWIAQIKCPVYLIHGTMDKTIPYTQTERLSRVTAGSPRRYFSVPGAGHSDLQDFPLYHRILYFLMNQKTDS